MAGIRLDQLLVQRGIAESREKAQRLILAGKVRVAGQVLTKAGRDVKADVAVEVEQPERFVGRGGEKLEGAFAAFPIDVTGCVCLDVGSSTGGFTDCLLQHGAAKVYAVDVGTNQLHWKLRQDPRVVVMEQVNARHLDPAKFPDRPVFACMDLSFISLTLVLPAVMKVLAPVASLVTLIKPQFEAGRDEVGEGGVVRDETVRQAVCDRVRRFCEAELGLACGGIVTSPLTGPAGNVEFLGYWSRR